jgi:hypothetical protein
LNFIHQQPFLGSGLLQRGQMLTASLAQLPSVNMDRFLISTLNGCRLKKTAIAVDHFNISVH